MSRSIPDKYLKNPLTSNIASSPGKEEAKGGREAALRGKAAKDVRTTDEKDDGMAQMESAHHFPERSRVPSVQSVESA
jgi:hypothetical protein